MQAREEAARGAGLGPVLEARRLAAQMAADDAHRGRRLAEAVRRELDHDRVLDEVELCEV